MIRINLLPHREQKRKARLQRFIVVSLLACGIGVAIVVAAYLALTAQIAMQDERNAFLDGENAKLDKQIAEIETLKKERQLLLDRKKVVERLQSSRAETVQILDQLVRQMPEGIYLKDVKQTGDLLTLTGYAQSSARVSTLMRSLNDSAVFEQPNLIEIKASLVNAQRLNEFNLNVKITREVEGSADSQSAAGQKKGN
ncbi:PilN domain-containing protein [Chitinimonas koreensis]|uniref:PilN domain-containing protein n=1 Tax=Chitinimonas koreensis TaxID=356302 RepID=UPI00041D36C8|nr:PilN domain-containing protein [Chitinimonas koreensis]QNM96463.1 PilN domain-containing protein [Chitinimonas koreensis]